jgi:hypothetical protein
MTFSRSNHKKCPYGCPGLDHCISHNAMVFAHAAYALVNKSFFFLLPSICGSKISIPKTKQEIRFDSKSLAFVPF